MRILILFFMTGAAAIAAEVAWLRLLQPAFGSTAEATAAVIGLYLAGLAAGSFLFGRLVSRIRRPVLGYLVVTGAAGLVLLATPTVYRLIAGGGGFGASLAGAILLLLPTTVLLGGAWPLLAEAIPRDAAGGGTGSLSLAHNLGGAGGGVLAGFLLMPHLGITGSLLSAAAGLLLVAFTGLHLLHPKSRVFVLRRTGPAESGATVAITGGRTLAWMLVYGAAGLVFIGVEVTWTRLFSLFFQNSVYTFSAVLATYLAGTAIGAALAAWAADRVRDPEGLAGLALASAGCLGLLPAIAFSYLVGIQEGARGSPGSVSYEMALFHDVARAAAVFLPGTIAMGALFPLVGRVLGKGRPSLGRPIGAVYGAGTLGSVFGGPVAGFLLIPALGAISTLVGLGAVAVAAGIGTILASPGTWRLGRLLQGAAILAIFAGLVIVLHGMPRPGEASLARGTRLIESREGRAAYAAVVVDERGHKRLRVNRSYSMGGDLGVRIEKRQGLLPMILHPSPRRVLVIGLGTGVTLGATASDPESEVVCVEILPEVIALSDHFREDHGDVLSNPRVRVVKEDGRTYLRESVGGWDLIVSDLFFPWRPGVGPLYAREHFETARQRLRPGGVYWQWFALHQLRPEEIRVLCATFASAFPNVELWLAGLSAEVPVAGLAGSLGPLALEVEDGIRRIPGSTLEPVGLSSPIDVLALRVAGDGAVRSFAEGARLHTDDRPLIEFSSPGNFFLNPLAMLRPNLEAMGRLLEGAPRSDPDPLGSIREAAAWCLRGEIARLKGEPVPEMQAHFRALEAVPELRRPREAILHKARAYVDGAKPRSALRILDTFLGSFPADPEATALRERALRATGHQGD